MNKIECAMQAGAVTAAEVNAMPERVRKYIQDIETMCDPQFIMQENWRLREENEALQIMYRKAADERDALLAEKGALPR